MAMTFVSHILYENWSPALVSDWIKGLDESIPQYADLIIEHGIDGRKLLMLTHYDLEKIGINKLGHQELILEAVDLLKSLRYGYDTENLQYLALQLGCKAKSLQREVQASSSENNPNAANVSRRGGHQDRLSVNILSSISDLITSLKSIVNWLDRAPFEAIYELCLVRNSIVKIGLELVSNSQKNDSCLTDIENNIIKSCDNLSKVCDELVIKNRDPLVIQPASLEIAIIRKKPGEELGITIQSAYYGIHVVGGIKEMSPADLCGKIEKGDEVIQVNNRTVVGWQLKSLVNILKEKPKEVTLLLKKRPHHINPYGQVPNKRKQMNKHYAQQNSTLPKSLKKRRSREGEPKNPRPSLQEFVSSVPNNNLLSVVGDENENASDDKDDLNDDGNDTDNDVFRSGSESPQYTLPVVTNTQHRRATVSGGSPTLSRTLLIIEDPDTPTRPKSFTITVSDIPHIDSVPGDENGFSKFGDKKSTAQQKRHDYKQTKSVPQSMEYVVKNSCESPKNDNSRILQNLKKTVALLEVPSQFQTPPRCVVSDSMEDLADQWNPSEISSSQETLTELTTKISTLTSSVYENEVVNDKNNDEDPRAEHEDENLEEDEKTMEKEVKKEPVTKVPKGILKHTHDDHSKIKEPQTEDGQQTTGGHEEQTKVMKDEIKHVSIEHQEHMKLLKDELKNMTVSSKKHERKEVSGSDNFQKEHVRKENSERDKNIAGIHDVPEHMEVKHTNSTEKRPEAAQKHQYSLPKTAPKDLDATFVDFDKQWNTGTTLAHECKQKNEPKLVKIRKRDSTSAVDMDKKSEGSPGSIRRESNNDDSSQVSYTTIVVGGVPQRILTSKVPQMEHGVTMRKKTKRVGDLNRRVSCKDLGQGDCEGWLYKKRSDKGGAFSSKWVKRWCVMKNYNLFYYKAKMDQKAEGVIHLPAFQVSPAPEIKTSKFAFKIHNLGTSFLFSSDRQEDMKKWMNKMGLAAIAYDEKKLTDNAIFPPVRRDLHDGPEFSESEEEQEHYNSHTIKDPDSSSLGSPDIRSRSKSPDVRLRLPGSDDNEPVFLRGSGCSSFTTGSVYSAVPTECSGYSGSTITGLSQSTDDLTKIYRTIENENLTIDGKSKEKQRRSAISSTSFSDSSDPVEHIEKLKRLHSLERTLKAKQQELEAIDKLLEGGIGHDKLRKYQEHFLLSASMRSLPTQSDSEEENF